MIAKPTTEQMLAIHRYHDERRKKAEASRYDHAVLDVVRALHTLTSEPTPFPLEAMELTTWLNDRIRLAWTPSKDPEAWLDGAPLDVYEQIRRSEQKAFDDALLALSHATLRLVYRSSGWMATFEMARASGGGG